MTAKRPPASTQRLLGRLARTVSEALLARLFGLLGLLVQGRRPARGRRPAPQRILLLRFGLLGDAVLWIPALRAARRLFPTARLEAVVSTYQYAVLSRFTYVDHFIVRDTGHFTRPAAWLRPSDVAVLCLVGAPAPTTTLRRGPELLRTDGRAARAVERRSAAVRLPR